MAYCRDSFIRAPAKKGERIMYVIRREDWDALPKAEKNLFADIFTIREGKIPGNNGIGGNTLLFEGIDFKIAD